MVTLPRQIEQHKRMADVTEPAQPLAVVIVTYNSSSVLPGLLDSLPAGLESVEHYEVVVIDNDSRDRSVDIALAHPIGARVIRNGRNAGYAAGINAAVATIEPDRNILVLNPDIRLYPGAARILNDRLRDPRVGVAVPQVLDEDGSVSRSLRREPSLVTAWSDALVGSKLAAWLGLSEVVADPSLYGQGGTVEWAVGAILAIAARARQAVGDWDESFFLYSEEVDYQERVRRCGLSIVYDKGARAIHIGGKTEDNLMLCAMMSSNRIRYYRQRHGSFSTMLFRLGVITGESMRVPLRRRHRAALRGALTA